MRGAQAEHGRRTVFDDGLGFPDGDGRHVQSDLAGRRTIDQRSRVGFGERAKRLHDPVRLDENVSHAALPYRTRPSTTAGVT